MAGGPGRPYRLAILLIVGVSGTPAGAQRYNFTAYTNQEGLPQRQVLAIAQDGEGYLWLGTYGGLSRFNGHGFITLRTSDGLSSNSVQDIVPSAGGILWVATSGGGVCQVRFPTVGRCFRTPEALLSDDVLDLEDDGRGGVWVGTYAGITHLDSAGTARHFPRAGPRPLASVWSVRRLGERTLGGHEGGVAEWRHDHWEEIPTNLPHTTVRGFAATAAGVWVASETGLYRVPPGQPWTKAIAVLPGVFVQDLATAGDTVWAATRSGLYRIDPAGVRHFTRTEGLATEVIHRVVVDREGTVWLGTDGGLFKLVLGPITSLSVDHGLPNPFVRAVGGDGAGHLYLGTRDGIFVSRAGKSWVIPGRQLPGPRVYAFLQHSDGSVWVGTNGGIAVLRGNRVARVLTEDHGLPSNAVYALALAEDGEAVWVASWAGLALVHHGRCRPLPPEVASLRGPCLQGTADGALWVGLRDGGVARIDPSWRVSIRRGAEGYTDQVVWSLARQGDALWLATNGDGALHVRGEQVERWDRRRGLIDDFVWQVLVDRKGQVWLFTSQGLDRLGESGIRHFGRGDGLPDLEGSANAAWEDQDGVLWFGTPEGVARYDPAGDVTASPPPPVRLEAAQREDGTSLAAGVTLPPRPGALTFQLASLSFRNEAATRFRYRLLPVQPEWSPPTRDGEIRYASLGPGRYRFEAVAVGSDGRLSTEPVGFPFAVATPWWRSPWAWLGTLLLVAASAWGWARWRVATSQALARRLEAVVEERTAELASKQAELEWLAATDELTKLPNRRRFFEVAHRELQRLSRSAEDARLALILIDLDGFKAINDTLGHTAGDAVLRAVGAVLATSVRGTDTAARFGGDEFAVVLPMTDRQGAVMVAEKLLRAIAALRVPWGGRELKVGASAGLAVVAPSAVFEEQEVVRFVQRADVALYAAKRLGGGRVLDDTETWA